jgi:hypothetical protein
MKEHGGKERWGKSVGSRYNFLGGFSFNAQGTLTEGTQGEGSVHLTSSLK